MAKMIKDVVSVALIVALVISQYLSGSGHGVFAANTESESDIASRQEFLDAHNQARAEVGVAPLRWSAQLAHEASLVGCYITANAYDGGNNAIASLGGEKYGANQLLLAYRETLTPRIVVESWLEEKKYYNHSANSCAPNHHCDSYTQVVWRKSLEFGCDMSLCQNGKIKAIFTLCYYNPPGNYKGQSPY